MGLAFSDDNISYLKVKDGILHYRAYTLTPNNRILKITNKLLLSNVKYIKIMHKITRTAVSDMLDFNLHMIIKFKDGKSYQLLLQVPDINNREMYEKLKNIAYKYRFNLKLPLGTGVIPFRFED